MTIKLTMGEYSIEMNIDATVKLEIDGGCITIHKHTDENVQCDPHENQDDKCTNDKSEDTRNTPERNSERVS